MMLWLYVVRLNIYKSLHGYFGKESHFQGTSKMNHFEIDDFGNEPLRKLFTHEPGHFGNNSFSLSEPFLRDLFLNWPILRSEPFYSDPFEVAYFRSVFFRTDLFCEVTNYRSDPFHKVTFWRDNFLKVFRPILKWFSTNRQIINHNLSKISNRYMDVLERLGRMPP